MLTIEEAAAQAKVSVKTIRRLIASGRLHAVNYGTGPRRKDWRIPPEALGQVAPLPEPEARPPMQPRPHRRRQVAVPADVLDHFPDAE